MMLVWTLLENYVQDGWPFALFHLLILLSILIDTWWNKLRLETQALRTWQPNADESEGVSQATGLLNRFVTECKTLGRKGVCVPMTDFSDRLDSIVDGMVTELHDRANLLIVVGVAGTMFALFEFGTRQGGVGAEIGFLKDAIRQAFPIGFMGLVLMLCAQFFGHLAESQVRTALSEATQKAIGFRAASVVTPAGSIEDIARSIAEAVKPLNELDRTLTKGIGPVVERVIQVFTKAADGLGVQIRELVAVATAIREVAGHTRKESAKLAAATDRVSNVLESIKGATEKIEQLRALQQETDSSIRGWLNLHVAASSAMEEKLATMVNATAGLPEDLKHAVSKSLEGMNTGLADLYRDASGAALRAIQASVGDLVVSLEAKVTDVQRAVEGAITSWNTAAINVQSVLKDPVQEMVEDLKGRIGGGLRALDEALREGYPAVRDDVAALSTDLKAISESLSSTRRALEESAANLEKTIKELEPVRERATHEGLTPEEKESLTQVSQIRDHLLTPLVRKPLGAKGASRPGLSGES